MSSSEVIILLTWDFKKKSEEKCFKVGFLMLISHCIFLFLDSTKAPLNDSLLKRLCIYSIPGLGATPVFIFSLKQAVLAPINLV